MGFSLVAASGSYSLAAILRLVMVVASLVVSTGCRARGHQQLWLLGSRAQAQ